MGGSGCCLRACFCFCGVGVMSRKKLSRVCFAASRAASTVSISFTVFFV
jgi:hypothetical protein